MAPLKTPKKSMGPGRNLPWDFSSVTQKHDVCFVFLFERRHMWEISVWLVDKKDDKFKFSGGVRLPDSRGA